MSKISSIKCEPQNIFMKQEYNIDESTEYNDKDGEFTYQWSVQDSKYTTENVEVQIKTEVDIIDDVIFESFFKRENYNYDPSIIMCDTSTINCSKSKLTNFNLNTKASTINLTPPKHKTALYKKKHDFSQNKIKSEKPYTCNICNKSFSLKGTLKTHLWIHMEDKPYKCFICNKSFSQASTLITHKLIHSADKPFNCDICKKSFAQKVNMRTHMMFHIGEKSKNENPYKSVMRNKLLSQGTTLSTQKKIRKAVIPFKCDICNKSFSYKGSLKTHLTIHTKEKPNKCIICNKSYSQKGYLKIHTRIHLRDEL